MLAKLKKPTGEEMCIKTEEFQGVWFASHLMKGTLLKLLCEVIGWPWGTSSSSTQCFLLRISMATWWMKFPKVWNCCHFACASVGSTFAVVESFWYSSRGRVHDICRNQNLTRIDLWYYWSWNPHFTPPKKIDTTQTRWNIHLARKQWCDIQNGSIKCFISSFARSTHVGPKRHGEPFVFHPLS